MNFFRWFCRKEKISVGEQRLIEMFYMLDRKVDDLMAQIDDLKAAVAAEATVEASAISLLNGLSAQLTAALSGNNPSADVQAVIDNINANTTSLAAAVTANTPAAPAP